MVVANGDEKIIKVCTLNVWGLYISSHRRLRIVAIADKLIDSDYDIVGVQELWVERDFGLMKRRLISEYPYSHRFQGGIIGSGLAIFSRHPIIHLDFYQYRLNGNPFNVHHGDWYAGKGVGLVRIKHPAISIDFFITHMVANYHKPASSSEDVYAVHRCMQMIEFCKFIDSNRHPDSAIISVGDLNVDSANNLYRVVMEQKMFLSTRTNLRSVWSDLDSPDHSTFNRPSNSFNNPEKVPESIDYIFYDPNLISCQKVSLDFDDYIPGTRLSFSDHCGVQAHFILGQHPNEHGGSPVKAEYYINKAIYYTDSLQKRQMLLQTISCMAFIGLLVSLFVTGSRGHYVKGVVVQAGNLLFVPAFLLISLATFMYSNLWLNYEINQITQSVAEWSLWKSE